MASSISVKVKNLQGKEFALTIDPNILVETFKEMLQEYVEIPKDSQRLIFLGKVLKDNQSMTSYGIKDGSTVHLVSRPPGATDAQNQPPAQPTPQQTPMNPFSIFGQMPNQGQSVPGMPGFRGGFFSGQVPLNQNPNQTGNANPQQNPNQPIPFNIGDIVNQVSQMFGAPAMNPQQPGQPMQPGQPRIVQLRFGPNGMPIPVNPNMPMNPNGMPMPMNPQNTNPSTQIPSGASQPTPQQQPQQIPPQMPQASFISIGVPVPLDPNGQLPNGVQPQPAVPRTPSREMELDQAASAGNLTRCRELVESGVDVNQGSLHKACMYGHRDLLIYLIERGAQPEAKLVNGETSLHTAAYYGQRDALTYLLDTCHVNLYERMRDGRTSLMLAVSQNYVNVAEDLIRRGANVHDTDIHGTTSLIMAAHRGNLEMVEMLLKNGANVNARDSKARTALHFAASSGHAHILSTLTSHGADVDAVNVNKESALHYATFQGKKECVVFLLGKGANRNLRSNSGIPAQLAQTPDIAALFS